MALARALSRLMLTNASIAPRCFYSLRSDKNTISSSAEGDDASPSMSSNRVMGWLRGPEANKPNKSVEEEWEELRDPQTGAVLWRSFITGIASLDSVVEACFCKLAASSPWQDKIWIKVSPVTWTTSLVVHEYVLKYNPQFLTTPGEMTVPGAPKPETWVEVVDKQTGLIYFWCRRTGETTVLGEPKPGPYGRKVQFDPEDLHLEDGRGGGKEAEGPSLMQLVANPLIIGVSLVAVLGVCYESFFK